MPRQRRAGTKRCRPGESKRYPMYMMSAAKFLELYESGTRLLEHHQLLKSRGDLKLFQVSPLEDHSDRGVFIFVSHEWASYIHPDPSGYQTRVLCRTLRQMIANKNEPFPLTRKDAVMDKIYPEFKFSHTLGKKTWNFKAEKMWIWMDYISIKQSNSNFVCMSTLKAAEEAELTSTTMPQLCTNREEIQEIAASNLATYIECTDIMLAFTPSLPNALQSNLTLGREIHNHTFRKRGWCVMELILFILCRKAQSKSLLLMRRCDGLPMSMSPLIIYNTMHIGKCEFTCRSVNHIFSENNKVPCDREIVFRILSKMLDRKIEYLWHHNMHNKARIFTVARTELYHGFEDLKAYVLFISLKLCHVTYHSLSLVFK